MWLHWVIAHVMMDMMVVYGCVWHTMMIDRVIDGDTVAIQAPMLPAPLNALGLKLRIQNVDCAETGHRARCKTESLLGEAATVFTRSLLIGSSDVPIKFQILLCGWDKYGGRVDGDIMIPSRIEGMPDRTLSEHLLMSGHARPYNGKGKRDDWCNKEEEESIAIMSCPRQSDR